MTTRPIQPAAAGSVPARLEEPQVRSEAGGNAVRVQASSTGQDTLDQGPTGLASGTQRAGAMVYLAGAAIDPPKVKGNPLFAPPRPASGQHIVQLYSQALPGHREGIEKAGGRIIGYLPDNAFLVRAPASATADIEKLPFVRATIPMPLQYKLDTTLRPLLSSASADNRRPVVVSVAGEQATAAVALELQALGFTNVRAGRDTIFAEGTERAILEAAGSDDVVWIAPDSKPKADLANVRALGGADFIAKNTTSFQGEGMRVHIFEGIEREHPGFAADAYRQPPIPIVDGLTSDHGTEVAGIVLGSGAGADASTPRSVGIVPRAQGFYTNVEELEDEPAQPGVPKPVIIIGHAPGSHAPTSRWGITKQLVEEHDIDSQTASWGHDVTTKYDERSRELDAILEEFDLVVTQSQGNEGSPSSRPEAWAKNVIPVTALYHFDNADFDDDRWNKGSSTRDGEDPRIGRTLSGFYDAISTATLHGRYTRNFGGTSAATPIVNGYMNIIIQMYKEGVFDGSLLRPEAHRPGQRPRAATAAALAIASARQHVFTGRTHENNRYRQGWGFPDVKRLYETRDRLFIVNEDVALESRQSVRYTVDVAAGEPELKISMVYKDPPGLVSAGKAQVNDLDLKVTAPDGTVFLGNAGLLDGNYSVAGGQPDRIDTVENVFVAHPHPGRWTIEVIGQAIHEPAANPRANFGLVALGARRVAA